MGSKAPPLEMEIQLSVVEDLGIKLYGYLPPVISEMVANAWDADATKVDVALPDEDSNQDFKIVVSDDGHGMLYEEIGEKYILVGRKRRDEAGGERTPGGRRPMGRKGIGKLSTFGVANTVEIETVRGGERSSFKMDLEELRKCAKNAGKYLPEVTAAKEKTDLGDGTTVTISNLKRKTPVNIQSVTRSIAKNFSAIGGGFEVLINGKAITRADKLTKEDMEHTWKVDDLIQDGKPDWRVTGWIGATRDPLNEEDRGIAILARKKLIQRPTLFDIKSGEYSYSCLTGEITAEFFDMEEDLVSTNRRSLIWETDEGEALKAWGNKRLRGIAEELAEKRETRNEEELMKDAKLRAWTDSLESPEKPVAKKLIKTVTADNGLDNLQRLELMNFVRNSIDHQVFMGMVAGLDESPKSADLLNMFKQWNVIENRGMFRIVRGRLRAIEQLEKHIKENTRDVPTVHDYFKQWPWILYPTLGHWSEEVPYSKLLREQFPDDQLDEPDRRMDFVSIGAGDTIYVAELKRPGYSAKMSDFDQITEYVGFVEEKLGNAPDRRYRTVSGYLIVGKVESKRAIPSRIKQAASARIYVKTYSDLVAVAKRLHTQKLEMFPLTGTAQIRPRGHTRNDL